MKKLLSALLALLILAGCVGCSGQSPATTVAPTDQPDYTQPTSAPMEPTEAPTEPAPTAPATVAYVEVSDGAQLKEALEAGNSVRLIKSFNIDNAEHAATIKDAPDEIYFDLNGHTVTATMSVKAHLFNLISSSMTVLDSSEKKNGSIRAAYTGSDCAVFRVNGDSLASKLTVLAGTYLYRAQKVVSGSTSSYVIHSNGTVVIWDGCFETVVSTSAIYGYGGNVFINGGEYDRTPKISDPCVLSIYNGKALVDCDKDGYLEVYRENYMVADPISWADLDAIPIADSSMTEDELRQICVDFMRLQLSFAWTPGSDFTYKTGGKNVTLYRGTVYGGLPYISSTGGNIYNALRFYDPATGVMDMDEVDGFYKYIGNQCSGAAFWAWARVSNSLTYGGTPNMLERNGCLRIGEYTYDQSITSFHEQGIRTSNIASANGRNVMFESYALMKPADGIVMYTGTAGHVCMISSEPVVVRKSDGSIDGEKSYVTYLEQTSSWKDSTQLNGQPIHIQGGLDVKVSFESLYKSGYLPWRVPELAGVAEVEKATATIGYTGSSIDLTQLYKLSLSTNYPLSDVTVTVVNEKGEVLYEKTASTLNITTRKMELKGNVLSSSLADISRSGEHTVIVSARVGTGEKIVAYEGVLIGK